MRAPLVLIRHTGETISKFLIKRLYSQLGMDNDFMSAQLFNKFLRGIQQACPAMSSAIFPDHGDPPDSKSAFARKNAASRNGASTVKHNKMMR